MNIDLPRVLNYTEAETKEGPLWWCADHGSIVCRCGCGELYILDGRWSVAADGAVTPSIWHNTPECGWHYFVRLLDWDPA